MALDNDDDAPARKNDDAAIVKEARRRFKRSQDVESIARSRFVDDLKFANGDAYNNYQWPDKIYSDRSGQNRPAMTINKVRQHNLQIINDARQNKTSIKIVATGDGATYDSAQVYSAVCRHIEYISNAQQIYTTATRFQVQAGIGYWRVETDWADDSSFDQEIFLRPCKNPLSIYLDPDIVEADGSDARYAFVFEEMAPDEFKSLYPKFKDVADVDTLGSDDDWCKEDSVRVAEYWRKSEIPDWLCAYVEGQGDDGQPLMKVERSSEMPPGKYELVSKAAGTKRRRVTGYKVERFKLAGDKILEQTDWMGKYIPIVRVPGEETNIDGQLDRKGHTRAMLDPQRNYNFWTSEAAAQVALQTKVPYMAPVAAISGYETVWANANVQNPAILPYKHVDEDGNPIPQPVRTQPPVMAQGYIQGMQIAQEELRMSSGQYQAEMGAPGNEKSGVAITARQRQADNATYHYVDHLAMAIRFTGKILIDLIPKVYDTPRVRRIMAEDGTESNVTIDVQAKQALQQPPTQQEGPKKKDVANSIFNPMVGKYDVEADVGPGFATRRQEAFNAFTQIAASNKEFMQIGGDLMWKAADFPNADVLAERWRRSIPPHLLGEGPTPEQQQMQQQLQQMQQVIAANGEQMQELERKLRDQAADIAEKAERVQIDAITAGTDAFDAETKRLSALKDLLATDPDALKVLIRMTIAEATNSPDPTTATDALAEPPPVDPAVIPAGVQTALPPEAPPTVENPPLPPGSTQA